MNALHCSLTMAITYLVGSLSFGAMVAKARGVDIFSGGSGSPGATNVKRTLGSLPGYAVFFLDFLKGAIPCLVILKLRLSESYDTTKLAMAGLLGILLGHSFSVFHGFRGGKGIASTMGGLLVIMPKTLVMGMFVWVVIFYATRIVSIASMCFTMSILLTSYLFEYPPECVLFAALLSVVIFLRHRENIIRLASGKEYRFEKKN
jgi:glycerol-3-phosphate acyltransferase PlsY